MQVRLMLSPAVLFLVAVGTVNAQDQSWLLQFGTTRIESVLAMAPDGAGGVTVAGVTEGNLGGHNAGAGSTTDVFLARFDGAGNRRWIRQFGTNSFESPKALAHDGAEGVMVAGFTWGSLGGPNAGSFDAFVAHFDNDGNQHWIRQFGSKRLDDILGLAPDGAGGVVVAGSTEGSLAAPNALGFDAFLAHYDETGRQLWIRQFGTSRDDRAWAIARNGAGEVMVAGYTRGSLGGPNVGDYDAFLALYTDSTCYADCDQATGVGVLDFRDFICFQNRFVNSEPYACDCDTSTGAGVCDVFDFLCFQNAFVGGCP